MQTPNQNRRRKRGDSVKQLRKMEKTMDGVGWTALVVTGLLILLVIMVQIGKRFYGW